MAGLVMGCAGPDVVSHPEGRERLTECQSFAVEASPTEQMVIWNMHPYACAELGARVSDSFQAKGYRQVAREAADFKVLLRIFASDSEATPRSLTLVLEVLDSPRGRRLWFGRVMLSNPCGGDPRVIRDALDGEIKDFLVSIPPAGETASHLAAGLRHLDR